MRLGMFHQETGKPTDGSRRGTGDGYAGWCISNAGSIDWYIHG